MVNCLQINLNRSGPALQLMYATAAELDIDVAIISEPPRVPRTSTGWNISPDGSCAVVVLSASLAPTSSGSGLGYAWITLGRILIVSCYCSPNVSLNEYSAFLNEVEQSVRSTSVPRGGVTIAGDFNAKSSVWGSASNDRRGDLLWDVMSSLGMTAANVGSTPTFFSVTRSSVVDITFTGDIGINGWRVMDDVESLSDHRYITFELGATVQSIVNPAETSSTGWARKKLNRDALAVFLNSTEFSFPEGEPDPANTAADALGQFLENACDACMPRRPSHHRRRQVHWWSDEIAELRRNAISANRSLKTRQCEQL